MRTARARPGDRTVHRSGPDARIRDYVAGDAERVAIGAMVAPTRRPAVGTRTLRRSRQVAVRRRHASSTGRDDDVLNTSWRTAGTPRHRSLHEVISWSYNLLDEDERRCLRHLSVFGGSVGSDGVLAVCDIPTSECSTNWWRSRWWSPIGRDGRALPPARHGQGVRWIRTGRELGCG